MLRIDNSSQQSPSLWESVLPPALFQMNEELTGVDKLLNDERFFTSSYERREVKSKTLEARKNYNRTARGQGHGL